MTDTQSSIDPSDRVRDSTVRFQRFLEEEVAPLEKELAGLRVGTPSQPHHDEAGRMHPAVWEARREVQRRSGALGFYAPHIGTASGGGGFNRVEMHYVEEYVYRHSGLGLGLAALAWTEGPDPATERISAGLRERYLRRWSKGS